MENVVETYTGTADKQITKEPTRVYWLHLQATTPGTLGIFDIYDGNSAADEKLARITEGYGNTHLFSPPILCKHALYVDVVSGLSSFTIGYIKEANLPPGA